MTTPTTPADRLIDGLLRWIGRELPQYLAPPRPSPVSASLISEDQSMLVYSVNFPPPGAPDVVTRKLSVNIDGTTTDVDLDAASAAHEIRGQQGQVGILTLVDVDDAGNASLPSPPYTFTFDDTLPPPAPGALGVTLVSEEPDSPTPA